MAGSMIKYIQSSQARPGPLNTRYLSHAHLGMHPALQGRSITLQHSTAAVNAQDCSYLTGHSRRYTLSLADSEGKQRTHTGISALP